MLPLSVRSDEYITVKLYHYFCHYTIKIKTWMFSTLIELKPSKD